MQTNLSGGAGRDQAGYLYSSAVVVSLTTGFASGGDATGDTFDSIEDLGGSEFNDRLTGDGGSNGLRGEGGNDTLNGGAGADWMGGHNGNDTYFVDQAGDVVDEKNVSSTGFAANGVDTVLSSISFSLMASTHVLGAVENLTLLNVAAALVGTGNNLSNLITGNNFNNTLTGGGGNDALRGGSGSDTLVGGAGIDTLTGGPGSDFFVFNAPLNAANRDVITDFSNVAGNNDTFRLENAVMTQLGGPGMLTAAKFFAGAAAHDADDRIVYNNATGALFYDSNGIAAGGAVQLGTLTNKAALTAADFVVI